MLRNFLCAALILVTSVTTAAQQGSQARPQRLRAPLQAALALGDARIDENLTIAFEWATQPDGVTPWNIGQKFPGLAVEFLVRDGGETGAMIPTQFTLQTAPEVRFGLPAPNVAGMKTFYLAARYAVTDATRWKCATKPGETTNVLPYIVDCGEAATSFTVNYLQPTPPPLPAPTGPKIIRTTTVAFDASRKALGWSAVELTLNDKTGMWEQSVTSGAGMPPLVVK